MKRFQSQYAQHQNREIDVESPPAIGRGLKGEQKTP